MESKQGLTKKQSQFLDTIKSFCDRYGYSPSYDELAGIEGCSISNARRFAKVLEKRGHITSGKGARSIKPL
jgi:SOS-response transcriptional repressor LexA